jgi:hypothetical protein
VDEFHIAHRNDVELREAVGEHTKLQLFGDYSSVI